MSFLDSQWQGRLELLLAAGRSAGAELVEIFLERFDCLGLPVNHLPNMSICSAADLLDDLVGL